VNMSGAAGPGRRGRHRLCLCEGQQQSEQQQWQAAAEQAKVD
jgi:hypothetical protein